MVNPGLYPLKFTPILKEKIWGGNNLKKLFNKNVNDDIKIGESWELSGVKENISIVSEGPLKGKNLNHIIDTYGSLLLGKRVQLQYGNQFPLLFKYIDAAEDLSVQLHPNDELAKMRHNSFGKTEMWYIMQAADSARLLIGFKNGVDHLVYNKHISENNLIDIINEEQIVAGDAFFIAPGKVHAIGAGTVLAEIQQTSDITYRIYDWDRPGLDGTVRDLHIEEAKQAIAFKQEDARLNYATKVNETSLICQSTYFNTSKINCKGKMRIDYTEVDSFKVYMCVSGAANIVANDTTTSIAYGETLLIPACINQVIIISENVEILAVYIP